VKYVLTSFSLSVTSLLSVVCKRSLNLSNIWCNYLITGPKWANIIHIIIIKQEAFDHTCMGFFFLLILFHAVLCLKPRIIQLIETRRQARFCLLWVMMWWNSLLWLLWQHCFVPKIIVQTVNSVFCVSLCRSCVLFWVMCTLYVVTLVGNITALIFVAYHLLNTCFVA